MLSGAYAAPVHVTSGFSLSEKTVWEFGSVCLCLARNGVLLSFLACGVRSALGEAWRQGLNGSVWSRFVGPFAVSDARTKGVRQWC